MSGEPGWLLHITNGDTQQKPGAKAIADWLKEASDTSRNPFLILNIDDYNKPVYKFIISSLIKSWERPDSSADDQEAYKSYLRDAINHMVEWYADLKEPEKKDEFFFISALIKLNESYITGLDNTYDDKIDMNDVIEEFMPDFYYNFKKEHLRKLEFGDYFFFGLQSNPEIQKSRISNLVYHFGVDAQVRKMVTNAQLSVDLANNLKIIKTLDECIHILKGAMENGYDDYFRNIITPKIQSLTKLGVSIQMDPPANNWSAAKTTIPRQITDLQEYIKTKKNELPGSDKVDCAVDPAVPNLLQEISWKENIDNSPNEFLYDLNHIFPKVKRDKLDSLREIRDDNISLIAKTFEHESFNEICYLDLLIVMVTHLTRFNHFYVKIVVAKLDAISKWLVTDYPFKMLNPKGDLFDIGFMSGFVKYYHTNYTQGGINYPIEESDPFKRSKLLFRCLYLLCFLLKLKTAKQYNENGFENMNQFCDAFDNINTVESPFAEKVIDMKYKETPSDNLTISKISYSTRTIHFRKDYNFESGFNIMNVSLPKEFWQSLDKYIYMGKIRNPLSYFIGFTTHTAGECSIDADSFLQVLESQFRNVVEFGAFKSDKDAKKVISTLENLADATKKQSIDVIVGPLYTNFDSLTKNTYVNTASIFQEIYSRLMTIINIGKTNPTGVDSEDTIIIENKKEISELIKTFCGQYHSTVDRLKKINLDTLKKQFRMEGNKDDYNKFVVDIYHTCELLYFNMIPVLIACNGYEILDKMEDLRLICLAMEELISAPQNEISVLREIVRKRFVSIRSTVTNELSDCACIISLVVFILTHMNAALSNDINDLEDNLTVSERLELILDSPITNLSRIPNYLMGVNLNDISEKSNAARFLAINEILNGKEVEAIYSEDKTHHVFDKRFNKDMIPKIVNLASSATGTSEQTANPTSNQVVNIGVIDKQILELQGLIDTETKTAWTPRNIRVMPNPEASPKENTWKVTQMKYILCYIFLTLIPLGNKLQQYTSVIPKDKAINIIQWNYLSGFEDGNKLEEKKLLLSYSEWFGLQAPATATATPATGRQGGGAQSQPPAGAVAADTTYEWTFGSANVAPQIKEITDDVTANIAALQKLNIPLNDYFLKGDDSLTNIYKNYSSLLVFCKEGPSSDPPTEPTIRINYKLSDLAIKVDDNTVGFTDTIDNFKNIIIRKKFETCVRDIFEISLGTLKYIFDKRNTDTTLGERPFTIEEQYPVKIASDCFIYNLDLFNKACIILIETLSNKGIRTENFVLNFASRLYSANIENTFKLRKTQIFKYCERQTMLLNISKPEQIFWKSVEMSSISQNGFDAFISTLKLQFSRVYFKILTKIFIKESFLQNEGRCITTEWRQILYEMKNYLKQIYYDLVEVAIRKIFKTADGKLTNGLKELEFRFIASTIAKINYQTTDELRNDVISDRSKIANLEKITGEKKDIIANIEDNTQTRKTTEELDKLSGSDAKKNDFNSMWIELAIREIIKLFTTFLVENIDNDVTPNCNTDGNPPSYTCVKEWVGTLIDKPTALIKYLTEISSGEADKISKAVDSELKNARLETAKRGGIRTSELIGNRINEDLNTIKPVIQSVGGGDTDKRRLTRKFKNVRHAKLGRSYSKK